MNSHIDLIRNDFEKDEQAPVARIYVEPGTLGLIVKDAAGEHYEGNIFDTLGDAAQGPADRIIETLQQTFHGPYLVASDLHADGNCPFRHGPQPIRREPVTGAFHLPPVDA